MMHRLLILAAVLGLSVIAADAQAPTEPEKSPKEVVEQFWKMNADGAWSSTEGWDELQKLTYLVAPWSPVTSVYVLKGYRVGDARRGVGYRGAVVYGVEVDYSEWGEVDPFLNFNRARDLGGKSTGAREPVEQRIYETLNLSDRFVKKSLSGEEVEQKGLLQWRIGMPFLAARADVDTALRWVTQMRDRSTDPAIKYNADRTIAILKSLSAGASAPAQPVGTAQESPSEVGKRFVDLESDLMPDEWNKLTQFFVETPKPQWNKAHIVDIVGTGVDTNGDSAEVEISTNSLGELDSSLRLSNYPSMRLPLDTPSASACFGDDRFGFALLLSGKHWEIATDGTVKELDGPLAWRIEDTSFEPLITLDTAIRYVRQARDKTTDPVVKMNAARTLSILEYYKQGKPLPDDLCSDTPGSCG